MYTVTFTREIHVNNVRQTGRSACLTSLCIWLYSRRKLCFSWRSYQLFTSYQCRQFGLYNSVARML